MNLFFEFPRHHSILHQLDASELIHITPEVQEELDQRHRKLPFIQQNMQKLFSFGLELTAFSLQFIDYWLEGTIKKFRGYEATLFVDTELRTSPSKSILHNVPYFLI